MQCAFCQVSGRILDCYKERRLNVNTDLIHTFSLPTVNIVNEKIYVFLWFWFCFLFICTVIALIYRLFTITSHKARTLAIQSQCKIVNQMALDNVVARMNPGDWFVLDLLSKNLDPLNFCDLVNDLFAKENPKAAENISYNI